jgi:hypothetical protein
LDEERSPARKWIALALLAVLAGLAWKTIEAGKIRTAVLVILGAFGLRIILTASASR